MQITVKSRLKDFIRPLNPDEYSGLEADVIRDGCLEPLSLWKHDGENVLLDGHNRYKICSKHSIRFETAFVKSVTVDGKVLPIDSIERAEIWIGQHQKNRRNMEASDFTSLAAKLVPAFAEDARRRQKEAGEQFGNSQNNSLVKKLTKHGEQEANTGNEAKAVAQAAKAVGGTNRTYVAAAVKAAGYNNETRTFKKPDVLNKIGSGKGQVKIADVVREQKRTAIVEKLESVEAIKAKEITGKYDVFVIDPPWPMEKIERDERPNQVKFDYPTMNLKEIGGEVGSALKKHVDEDAHIFLWTTQKFLPDAFDLLEEWKLKYVCVFVWHKPGGFQPIGLPQYNAEFALYARKGSPKFVDTKKFNTCFEAPRGKHSEKPEEFYELLRRVTAGRRLDMFNRREIPGFDGWGKEAK